MKNFTIALKAYSKAVSLLFSRKFWWFMLFPVALIILLSWGGGTVVGNLAGQIELWIERWAAEAFSGIPVLEKMVNGVGFLGKMLVSLTSFLLFVLFGGYLIMIIMSPIYAWLSERVEEHLTGKVYPFNLSQFLGDIFRGIVISIRNSLFQILLSVVCLLLSFIPLLGLAVPIFLFIIAAYFYGFTFVDYAVERKRLKVKNRVRYIRSQAPMVLGIGVIFTLALSFSWLSLLICSFVSLLSVMASTIALSEIEQNKA